MKTLAPSTRIEIGRRDCPLCISSASSVTLQTTFTFLLFRKPSPRPAFFLEGAFEVVLQIEWPEKSPPHQSCLNVGEPRVGDIFQKQCSFLTLACTSILTHVPFSGTYFWVRHSRVTSVFTTTVLRSARTSSSRYDRCCTFLSGDAPVLTRFDANGHAGSAVV